MIVDHVQRQTERRISRRPAHEPIRPSEYEAAIIEPGDAKAFVVRHHYAGTCGPTAHPIGLYRFGALVGVACFGPLAESRGSSRDVTSCCASAVWSASRPARTRFVDTSGRSIRQSGLARLEP